MKTYSTEDAANRLNISVVTLRRWVQNNKIDFLKMGKLYRFTEDTLKSFYNMNTKKNDIQNISLFDKNENTKNDVIISDNIIGSFNRSLLEMDHGSVNLSVFVRDGVMKHYKITREDSIVIKDNCKDMI